MNNRKVYHLLFLVAIVLVVFSTSLWNNFVLSWDDRWMIFNKYTEGGLSLNNIKAIFTEYYAGQYSPLNQLFYTLIFNIVGYDPLYFHLYSLFLHIVNTILVYFLFSEIFKYIGPSTYNQIKYIDINFFVALIFAIHPLQVESVCWISASKVLLFSAFYLGGSYLWLLYMKKLQLKYLLLTCFCLILSFCSKEQAVTFPVWILFFTWYFRKEFSISGKRIMFSVIPLFLITTYFSINALTGQAGTFENISLIEKGYPFWQRLQLACFSLVEYIHKFLIPYNLKYIYPFPFLEGATLPTWIIFFPLLIGVAGWSLWRFIEKRPVDFAVIFFLIHIGITLHIIPLSRFAVVADRYIYLAIPGLSILLYLLLAYFCKTIKSKKRDYFFLILVVYTCGLCLLSFNRSFVWKDGITLKHELKEIIDQKDKNI